MTDCLTPIHTNKVACDRFIQYYRPRDKQDAKISLESLLREVFPIVSYDGNMQLEYQYYKLDEPRYTPDECRELRLTYGMPFRIGVRFVRKDVSEVPEEEIYLGEVPVMLGGGEYIINGAERVIVNQLHRSPGVDFSIASSEGDRPLHSARIIPERGSWIELEVSKKDVLQMRIDQSTKIPATTFLRALDEDFSTTQKLLETFYNIESIKVTDLQAEHYAAAPIVDTETGEEIVPVGGQIGEKLDEIIASPLKKIDIIANPGDMLLLNTIADEKQAHLPEGMQVNEHEAALLALYARLRPGNPPQVDKARALFEERFYDENRYRLGKVGRFRINRKFEEINVKEDVMRLRSPDFLAVINYMLDLRSNRNKAHIDDIDHLGNRRLRTLDELGVEELRKGFLKLRRTVQERMSVKDPDEMAKIADYINSKSISSAIEHFFGRGELSQVVDQTNPLSQLTHERRLSALGPGGLNRKRAGFEVRDVHISHYGRICPIETPEGMNIGLIASLGIYSEIDDYGFLQTPYRRVEDGRVVAGKKGIDYLRADEEMKSTLGPTDAIEPDGTVKSGLVLARVDGDLAQVPSKQIDHIDISPKQIVGVSAALIPFLEHDDANRALMGSNMQRQAVPLIKTDPPCVGTGMEKEVPRYSGMVVRAKRPGVVTYVDAQRIVVDNADEYELRKFVGLNERTCQNQKPIVSLGEKVRKDQIIADGAATHQGELALGKNALVAFNTFDGYNFEDAIVISERLVKEDVYTSIHIEEFDVEIRETKLGREEFTRDIPNVSEKMLSQIDENGMICRRTGFEVCDVATPSIHKAALRCPGMVEEYDRTFETIPCAPTLEDCITGEPYWRSLEERANSRELIEQLDDEFQGYDPEELQEVSRRTFLKLAGASLALAGLTLSGCRRWPKEELAPFAARPEDLIPGVPNYFASMAERGGVAHPMLVASFDGRPIKVESHPKAGYATDVYDQALLLQQYDPERLRDVGYGAGEAMSRSSWTSFEGWLTKKVDELKVDGGKKFAVLAEPTSSPTALRLKAKLKAALPASSWVTYEPLGQDSAIQGSKDAFDGKAVRTQYDVSKAKVIACFDCDFLSNHPSATANAKGWAVGRKSVDTNKKMNRMYVVESAMSVTGSAADERLPVKPSRVSAILTYVGVALGVGASDAAKLSDSEKAFADKLVKDLKASGGSSIVVAGSGQSADVHAYIHAINKKLGTLDITTTYSDEPAAGDGDITLAKLVEKINDKDAGIDTLLILGGNPVFDAPADLKFGDALGNVKHAIKLGLYRDETVIDCEWALPAATSFECWGDGRWYDGTVAVQQPLILPLFNGRSSIELLAAIIGEHGHSLAQPTGYSLVRETFKAGELLKGAKFAEQLTDAGYAAELSGFEKNWRRAVHLGFVPGSAFRKIYVDAGNTTIMPKLGESIEFNVICQLSSVYDGRFANNPWLQECSNSPEFLNEQHDCGATIDLTSYIGCISCVVVRQADNNISPVDKEQVSRLRETHWLRESPNFEGTAQWHEDLLIIHQPGIVRASELRKSSIRGMRKIYKLACAYIPKISQIIIDPRLIYRLLRNSILDKSQRIIRYNDSLYGIVNRPICFRNKTLWQDFVDLISNRIATEYHSYDENAQAILVRIIDALNSLGIASDSKSWSKASSPEKISLWILSRINATVHEDPNPIIDGYTIRTKNRLCIYISSSLSLGQKNHVMLHELSHLLLSHDPTSLLYYDRDDTSEDKVKAEHQEIEAELAAGLLAWIDSQFILWINSSSIELAKRSKFQEVIQFFENILSWKSVGRCGVVDESNVDKPDLRADEMQSKSMDKTLIGRSEVYV